jgi:MFS family permease
MSRQVWERDFRLLWSGSAVSQFGAVAATTATPLLALSLSRSPATAGLATAAGTLPVLMFQLPAGWLADRADRRRIMLVAQLVRVLAAGLLVVVLGLLNGPLWLLFIAVVVIGTCTVFYSIAESAAVRDILYGSGDRPGALDAQSAGRRKKAMASHEARNYIALVGGRPFGGFAFGYWQFLPYAIDAVMAVCSLGLLKRMAAPRGRVAARRNGPERGSAPGRFMPPAEAGPAMDRSGRSLLAKDRFLWTLLSVCAVANFFFQAIVLLLIVSAERRGISASMTGIFLSVSGVAGLAGAIVAPLMIRDRKPQRIVLWWIWGWPFLVLVVALADNPLWGLVAWGSCSFVGVHVNIALELYKAERVPGRLQGKVTSVSRFLTSGAVPLGALGGGYLITVLGPSGTAGLAALVMAMLAVLMTAVILLDGRAAAGRAATSGDLFDPPPAGPHVPALRAARNDRPFATTATPR